MEAPRRVNGAEKISPSHSLAVALISACLLYSVAIALLAYLTV